MLGEDIIVVFLNSLLNNLFSRAPPYQRNSHKKEVGPRNAKLTDLNNSLAIVFVLSRKSLKSGAIKSRFSRQSRILPINSFQFG